MARPPPSRHHPHPADRSTAPALVARHHEEVQRLVNKTMSQRNDFLERLRSVSEKHIRESERCRGAAASRRTSHRGNSTQKSAAAAPKTVQKSAAAAPKTVMQPATTPPATILSRTNSMGQSVVSSLGETYAESPRFAVASFSSTELVQSVKEKVHQQFQVLADLAERVTTLGSGGRPPRWVNCQGGDGDFDDDDDCMDHVPTNTNDDSPCVIPACIIVNPGKCSTENETSDDDTNDSNQNTKDGEKDADDLDDVESLLATIGTATTKEETDTTEEEEFTTTVSSMAER